MQISKMTGKITLPIAIITSAFLLGTAFYMIQINKQDSIEKQQALEAKTKKEIADREYKADRKKDCLEIYETESDNWNNVNGWSYDEFTDSCSVEYKKPSTDLKSDAECDALYPTDEGGLSIFIQNNQCKSDYFTKSF